MKYGKRMFTAVLMVACMGVFLPSCGKTDAQGSDAPVQADAQDAVQELQGTVKDAAMHSLLVVDADGNEYSFGTEGVPMTTGESGLLIGNPVTVSYRGSLDAEDVELVSIAVADAAVAEQSVAV